MQFNDAYDLPLELAFQDYWWLSFWCSEAKSSKNTAGLMLYGSPKCEESRGRVKEGIPSPEIVIK